jgi:hypothetical protein
MNWKSQQLLDPAELTSIPLKRPSAFLAIPSSMIGQQGMFNGPK